MTRERMRKVVEVLLGFALALLLGAMMSDWVAKAWAQARTVMYKDYAQTVEVAHDYNTTTPGPPMIVTGNSLGVPAPGFAPDMFGPVPWNSLPTPGTAGRVRILEDGSAAGSPIFDDGAAWNCGAMKDQQIHIVTCPPYNAKGDGVTNDSAAITAAIGTGNRTVLIPPGTYLVAGLLFKSNLRILGQGVGITTLKLPNATQNGIFGNYPSSPVNNLEVAHLTVDGNAANQTNPSYAVFGVNGATNFWFHHLDIKDSIEYCMGLEHGVIHGRMSDMTIGPCRWDGIDIKNTQNDSRVEITNVSVHAPGTTYGASPGVTNAVCIDSGGRNRLTNVRCTGLTNQTYGFSFRRHQTIGTNCDVAFCEGGDGSSLSNFLVEGDGTTTTLGAGVLVRDAHIQVSNGFIRGMGRGVYVESDPGVGSADYVMVSNVVVMGSLTTSFATDNTAFYTSFVNCSSIDSLGTGAEFLAGSVRFIGSAVTNAASHGISIGGTSQHIKIEGSTITQNTGYGIYVGPGTAHTIIVGNTILANGNNLADAGTNTMVYLNYGVATATQGQETIPSGATSVVVNHGLDFTPDAQGIAVTLLENPTAAVGAVWVDTVTATQFTVNVENDPGASNLDFGWQARVRS